MVNDEILDIKDQILKVVPDCEKIFLFGSYAYGTPHRNSDYDFYVVLNDDCPEMAVHIIQRIYRNIDYSHHGGLDLHANYKNRFEDRARLPTLERTIQNKGILLYDRA
ncbi:MAG: nucleotidyltransferase domain-containing protein [Spirochaetaceae bacterium]|jgi:predicted nucleotidyltransferase|nr:nucleotidyltransferase domain-containing protein [Spirochaetaceae bacterium]